MAGGFITDLKFGYWLGTTPIKQQQWKFLGTLLSAATVGIVIYVLNQAYGFQPGSPDALVAPQANAMAAVIEPLMLPGAQVHWMLFVVGALISLLVNWLGISPLAFALGMFIPLDLNTPLLVGGLIAHFVAKSSKDKQLNEARTQRGTLIASGFIAGAALFGVLGALILFFGVNLNLHLFQEIVMVDGQQLIQNGKPVWDWIPGNIWPELLGLIAFAVLIGYFIWEIMRAKVED